MNATVEVTKQQALDLYAGNHAALGRALGVSRQYVQKLSDGPLPEWMSLKLRYVLHPDVLGAPPKLKRKPPSSQEAA